MVLKLAVAAATEPKGASRRKWVKTTNKKHAFLPDFDIGENYRAPTGSQAMICVNTGAPVRAGGSNGKIREAPGVWLALYPF